MQSLAYACLQEGRPGLPTVPWGTGKIVQVRLWNTLCDPRVLIMTTARMHERR